METTNARVSIKVHDRDNVATLLDDRLDLATLADGMAVQAGIGMGHKVALADIPAGAPVIKYGVTIGVATQAISKGEHVHVHNCA